MKETKGLFLKSHLGGWLPLILIDLQSEVREPIEPTLKTRTSFISLTRNTKALSDEMILSDVT